MRLNTVVVEFNKNKFTFSDDYKYIRLSDVIQGIPSGDFVYSLAKACSGVTKDEITIIAEDEQGKENKYMNYDNVCKHILRAQESMSRTLKVSTTTVFKGIQTVYDFVAESQIPSSSDVAEITTIYKALAKLETKLQSQDKAQKLLKEIKALKDQLATSENKAEELRKVNLRLVDEKSNLELKVVELETFRNKIMEATGKTLTA